MTNSFAPPAVRSPFEKLLKGSRDCGCQHRHSCKLRQYSVTDGEVWLLLPPLLKKLHAARVHFISEAGAWALLGARCKNELGALGFTVSDSVFPAEAPDVCSHDAAGSLLMHIPQQAEVLVAVGERAICDLAKFVAEKNRLPLIILPTAAATDSFAMPVAEFLENDHRIRVPAASPYAILADLSVLSAASMQGGNAGVGAALANYVSLADWQLSEQICGSWRCETLARQLLALTDEVLAVLRQGRSVRSPQVLEPLMNCLVGAGVITQLAGTDAPVRGGEAALAAFLEQKLVAEDITDYSFDELRGLSALYALRMYHALSTREFNFVAAQNLFAGFGWSYFNSELFRVLGETQAHAVLSRLSGSGFYNADLHKARVRRIADNFDRLRGESQGLLPPYNVVLAQLRALSFPTTLAELDLSREEALDALVWSKEASQRYTIFRLLADLGELEQAAHALTSRMVP